MKMKYWLVFLLGCWFISMNALTIYQIQYTTNPGRDNTYPSPYIGKAVVVEGIVTAVGYKSGGFFISEPSGGAWRSIYIRTNSYSCKAGDKVIVRGTVGEYFGMTCIQDITGINVMDSRRHIPLPLPVTTGQITTAEQAEAYESVLVRIQNASALNNTSTSASCFINDGSGLCSVENAFLNEKIGAVNSGEVFANLKGIICYAYGKYSLNPRSRADISIMAPVFNLNRSWGRIKSIYK